MTMPATADGSGITLTFAKQDYSLPSDYARMVSDTNWDRTNHWRNLGTKSSQEWQWLQGGVISIGRTMSQHWLLQGRAGVGITKYLRLTVAAPRNVQYTAGGSIAYKVSAHTLIASFDRELADSYGLGSASTDAAMGGWAWKVRGSSWSLSAIR